MDFTAFGPELDGLGLAAKALPNLIKQPKTLIEVYPIPEGPTQSKKQRYQKKPKVKVAFLTAETLATLTF